MNKYTVFCLFALVAFASTTSIVEPISEAATYSSSSSSSTFNFNILANMGKSELYMAAIVLIALGVVNLLWGLKYAKMIIFGLGFIISASVAFAIETMKSTVNNNGTVTVSSSAYLGALVAGIIGGCVFYFCYHCSIFTIGFFLGAGIVFAFFVYLLRFDQASFGISGIFALAGGVAGGIIALKINDLVLIVSTSFAGATYLVYAITIFLYDVNFMTYYSANTYWSLINLALAICGIVYQLKNKEIKPEDLQRNSVAAPDVYVIDMNNGTEAYNPYTGRKF